MSGMMRAVHAVLVLAVSLLVFQACGFFTASQPLCTGDGGTACTEDWCDQVRVATRKRLDLCREPSGECDLAVSVDATASDLRRSPSPGDAAASLGACASRKSTCQDVKACFSAILPKPDCPNVDPSTASSVQPLLPTRISLPSGRGTAGVVVLPGDDLQCLSCAFQPKGCAEASPDCFSSAPTSTGSADTCLEYRTCLRMCEQSAGDDARRYALCAQSLCGTAEHTAGKAAFARYRKCMFDNCADCFK